MSYDGCCKHGTYVHPNADTPWLRCCMCAKSSEYGVSAATNCRCGKCASIQYATREAKDPALRALEHRIELVERTLASLRGYS